MVFRQVKRPIDAQDGIAVRLGFNRPNLSLLNGILFCCLQRQHFVFIHSHSLPSQYT
jgi:hypothetical protein